MKKQKITKAVFPVGGLGTRFLPATKATPKEMLSVVDKPLIQYAVEEAVEAGIDTLIFINGRNKTAITNHFDKAYELEHQLELKEKEQCLAKIQNIVPRHVGCIYIRQSEALGLGHAVLCAKKVIGNEAFAVLLADDLIDGGTKGCMQQMVEQFNYSNQSIIAVQEVEHDKTDQYGIVQVDDKIAKNAKIEKIVEKPKPEVAPSNRGVVGRYILTPKIFELLENTKKGAGGEIQLTDAISELLKEEQVNAYAFDGIRYDCGSKEGFLEANMEYGLQHPDIREHLINYLEKLHERFRQDDC
ncbi:MAG: UTP--glucose-1-phosphate uridylyltransferase GalU [Candidatus Polarisedimenticolaceae bacterium]|nr:UTP--glucose-1-phosphate uridylyltransferase GalU [Candidatus Polarisedimenticolaceae bacterium]